MSAVLEEAPTIGTPHTPDPVKLVRLRPNGLWLAELEAHDEDKARTIATMKRWRWFLAPVLVLGGAFADAVIRGWVA